MKFPQTIGAKFFKKRKKKSRKFTLNFRDSFLEENLSSKFPNAKSIMHTTVFQAKKRGFSPALVSSLRC